MRGHYVTVPGFIFKIEWTARQKFASRLVDDSILLCPGTGCSMTTTAATTTTTIDRAQAEKAVNALLKPTLQEVLDRRTRAPLDLFCFYVRLSCDV